MHYLTTEDAGTMRKIAINVMVLIGVAFGLIVVATTLT